MLKLEIKYQFREPEILLPSEMLLLPLLLLGVILPGGDNEDGKSNSHIPSPGEGLWTKTCCISNKGLGSPVSRPLPHSGGWGWSQECLNLYVVIQTLGSFPS